MRSFLRIFSASIIVLSLSANTLCADTFVILKSPKKHAPISPLTPFDEALKREMQKYPKDSAFFVDGRTGKILSVNKLPKRVQKPLINSSYKTAPKPKKPAPKIPYEMQEERIELLQ
ncbi:hypothetical protein [uncultured Helicobacter sp.]|uniref:hypothetical protein n=1 Tax=uncultured Helicobacter sp. TaxID=175537 RepID=UPI00262AA67C|nr:hypothetical protein [uncultured Helicobacter sp.]